MIIVTILNSNSPVNKCPNMQNPKQITKEFFSMYLSLCVYIRLGVMLNVMVMHCNALHVFKVMLVMCNATKLALQVMVM